MALNSSCRENGEIVITSGDRLTIENAAVFSCLVREALESSKKVVIEFEPAVEIDITGMQILCSACKTAAADGKIFVCSGTQPEALSLLVSASGAERRTACKYNNDSPCTWFGGEK